MNRWRVRPLGRDPWVLVDTPATLELKLGDQVLRSDGLTNVVSDEAGQRRPRLAGR